MDLEKPNCEDLPKVYRTLFELLNDRADKEDIAEVAEEFDTLTIHFKDCDYKFHVKLTEEGEYEVVEELEGRPKCMIITDSETLHNMFLGEIDAVKAYMAGKIKFRGVSSLKMQKLFPKMGPLDECYREALEKVGGD